MNLKNFVLFVLAWLCLQTTAIAKQSSTVIHPSLIEIESRYSKLVNNEGEGNIYRKIQHHDSYDVIGEILAQIVRDAANINESKLMRVWRSEAKKNLKGTLFGDGSLAFFCEALIGESYHNQDAASARECESKTEELLGHDLQTASEIYIHEISGNNYGSWHDVNLILVFETPSSTKGEPSTKSSSVVLTFEMHHEI